MSAAVMPSAPVVATTPEVEGQNSESRFKVLKIDQLIGGKSCLKGVDDESSTNEQRLIHNGQMNMTYNKSMNQWPLNEPPFSNLYNSESPPPQPSSSSSSPPSSFAPLPPLPKTSSSFSPTDVTLSYSFPVADSPTCVPPFIMGLDKNRCSAEQIPTSDSNIYNRIECEDDNPLPFKTNQEERDDHHCLFLEKNEPNLTHDLLKKGDHPFVNPEKTVTDETLQESSDDLPIYCLGRQDSFGDDDDVYSHEVGTLDDVDVAPGCVPYGGNGHESLSADRLLQLEQEQEHLNCSLMALTTHFAQVQFRLKQIVGASPEQKESLLKELEEFAFRGIPELKAPPPVSQVQDGTDSNVTDPREKQKELMFQLKNQLQELEQYAYETGEMNHLPSSILMERQTVIIEQLKGRLPINLDDMDRFTPDQLRAHVDQALQDLINPGLMKEQLVEQLKTQVTDLERFIQYLQKEEGVGSKTRRCIHADHGTGNCTCDCPLHGNLQKGVDSFDEKEPEKQEAIIKIMKRVMTLLQMITFAQFGCNRNNSVKRFERNILKKNAKGNHWGDLRARLEVAIDHLVQINTEDSDYTSDCEDTHNNQHLVMSVVRKELCPALKDLLEHGLNDFGESESSQTMILTNLLDWGCFSGRSSQVSSDDVATRMTIWDLLIRFFRMKDGDRFSTAPARKLSQSFNLKVIGGMPVTAKHTLLMAIADIEESHTPLKRSAESHFKAIVSRGLNEGRLSSWIRVIVKSRTLIPIYYEPWSYVASTGFDDALKSLDRLTSFKFDLPIDLAIRQLNNIHDAF